MAKRALPEASDSGVLEADLDAIAFGIAKRVLRDPLVDRRYFRTLKAEPPKLPPPPEPGLFDPDTLRVPPR